MKTLMMTPQLAEQLADFCDPEGMEARISALEQIQDFIISVDDSDEHSALIWLRFIRNLKDDLQQLCRAMPRTGDAE